MNYDFLKQWQDVGRSLNHSSFDLSRKQCITLPASLLCPNLFLETMPNEHHKINLQGLLRTQTLNTAAFVNGSFYTNVFFVPYKQLWHNFNDFISQKEDRHSSRLLESNFVPNVLLTDVLKMIWKVSNTFTSADKKTLHGYDWALDAMRLLQFCKYGNYFPVLSMSEEELNTYCSSIDEYCQQDQCQQSPRYINLFRVLAYQHIFYDYYRNKYYDEKPFICQHVHDGDAYNNAYRYLRYIDTFNLDDMECSDAATSHLSIDNSDPDSMSFIRAMSIFSMHTHQYKRDIYTSAMPSSQFGSVSSLSLKDINILNNEPNPNNLTAFVSANNTPIPNALYSGGNFARYTWSIPDAFDVLSLRKAELMQAWKQNALRAGNMVDDNFRSHYGVEPYYEEDNNVKFLGSFSCHLDINPVTSTAATSDPVNGQVGDLAAIGVGQYGGNEINFESKDFGVIVGITSFVPDVYYNANGVDKQNTLIEPFDYYYPEFQNVGFETVSLHNQTVASGHLWNFNLGFVPPQSWYKTAVDEVFGDFSSIDISSKSWSGYMSQWTLIRDDLDTLHDPAYAQEIPSWYEIHKFKSSLYISPGITDPLFASTYDSSPHTDPFALALNWSIRSIRPMSVLGLPQFT